MFYRRRRVISARDHRLRRRMNGRELMLRGVVSLRGVVRVVVNLREFVSLLLMLVTLRCVMSLLIGSVTGVGRVIQTRLIY